MLTSPSKHPRPTRRWLNLLILAVVLYFFANRTQVGWLYIILALLLALLGLSFFLARRNVAGIRGEIDFLDGETQADWWEGDEVSFRYLFEREKNRGESYQLELEGRCPVVGPADPQGIKRWFLPKLGPDGISETEVVTLYKRGLFHIRPFVAECRFPFGLFYVKLDLEHVNPMPEIIVYPEIRPLKRFPFLDDRPLPQTPVNRSGIGNEFLSVRPFRPGDSPRHIHWRSVARTGQLISKEFAEEREPGMTLKILNRIGGENLLSPEDLDFDSKESPFEVGIKMAASIGDYLLRQGYRLYLTGDDAPRGPVTADMLWQYLARLEHEVWEPDGLDPVEAPIDTDLILISPFSNDQDKSVTLSLLSKGRRCLLIDFDLASFPSFEVCQPGRSRMPLVPEDSEDQIEMIQIPYRHGQVWTDLLEGEI